MAKANRNQIYNIACLLKDLPMPGHGLNFYSTEGPDSETSSEMFPDLNHPEAINFFFFTCMHQFGFWYGDNLGYIHPLFGKINGKISKGSDLLWMACKKALDSHESIFRPESLAAIEPEKLFGTIFCDDNGPIPFPDLDERFMLTRAYGRWLKEDGSTPMQIVEKANASSDSLEYFLRFTSCLPGYDKDDYLKKNLLLAMALANRPENFLFVQQEKIWPPLVDYHLMRVALRQGMVELQGQEYENNKNRSWVNPYIERSIREETYSAFEELIEESGLSMFAIDEIYWTAREWCPEMSEPECAKCDFERVCKKRTELFQPVFRTTAY